MIKNDIIVLIKKKHIIYKMVLSIYKKINSLKKRSKIVQLITNVIQNKTIRIFEMKSVFNYLSENNIKITILEEKKDRIILIPKNLPDRCKEKIEVRQSPCIYYSEIENTSIIGGSNVIIKDLYYLNDKFDLNYSNEIEFIVGPVVKIEEKKCSIEINKKPNIINKGIYLVGEASNNYYHWMFDILGRLLYLNKIDNYSDYPLLIDETVARHPTCLEILRIVDVKKHPIIFVSLNQTYNVKKLVYISPTTWSSVYRNEKLNSYAVDRYMKPQWMIDEYQRLMFDKTKELNISAPKRLFIIRSGEKVKRLINEDELCTIAQKYGFVPYEPSSNTMLEQVKIFNNADYIIAASGAALVNLMWCHKGCKVICVSPIAWNDYNYSTLAYLSGAECIYLNGNLIDEIKHRVDTTIFESAIDEFVN